MPLMHGKKTVVKIDDAAITNANQTQLEFTMDTEDVTVYGKDAHVFAGGLAGGSGTISGFADDTAATGNAAVLKPLVKSGETVELIVQPKGAGSGFPQDKVDVVVTKYTQTSPVAGYVQFAIDVQFSDDVDSAAQPA